MIAVVTGASSGIGEATARRLAAGVGGDQVRLVLVARREERLRALADELGGATIVAVDLTDEEAPARVREALDPWGEVGAGELELMRRVKARFDPDGTCNPGVFVV